MKTSTMVIGGSKTGKTRLFGTYPRPSLLISLEPGGYKSIQGKIQVITDLSELKELDKETVYVIDLCTAQKVSVTQLTDSSAADIARKLIDTVNWLWDNPTVFKSAAIDSLTGMQNPIKHHALRWNSRDIPVFQDWGQIIDKIDEIITAFVALPINTLVTAHIQLERNELTGELVEQPLVFGKQLPNKLMMQFDNIFQTQVIRTGEDSFSYKLRTKPTDTLKTLGSRTRSDLPTLIDTNYEAYAQ